MSWIGRMTDLTEDPRDNHSWPRKVLVGGRNINVHAVALDRVWRTIEA